MENDLKNNISEEKASSPILMYDEKNAIPDSVLHYLHSLGIKEVMEKELEGDPKRYIVGLFDVNGNKLNIIKDREEYLKNYKIELAGYPVSEALRIEDEQITFTRHGEIVWRILSKENEDSLYIGLGYNSNRKHIIIGTDKFGNIKIVLDKQATDFWKTTGQEYTILVGQEHLTPKEYIESLLDNYVHDDNDKLYEMMLHDPRIVKMLEKLLARMPKSLKEATDKIKEQLELEYKMKLAQLNDEIQELNERVFLSEIATGLVSNETNEKQNKI